ncbi:MAG TPA: universal stress protein [Candidatus Dormibacteraeota bacterium]|nr:universal stress protein [Candidatus Dormibacteraeota bacterium]
MTTTSERPAGLGQAQVRGVGPVVLATDGSADAEVAMRAAGDVAMGAGVSLHVVSAWSTPVLMVPYGGFVAPDMGELYEREDRALVGEVADRLARSGVGNPVRHPVAGRPADAVLGCADDVDAGLIVMGSRGMGAVRRLVLGSVAEEVVCRAHRPVLVTRGGPNGWPPGRIIVGDDGSRIATAAVVTAAALGRALCIPVVVMTVLPRLREVEAGISAIPAETAMRRARATVADRVAALSDRTGIALEAMVGVGDAAATLIDAAADQVPSLLVVGSRGLGAIGRMRHGSVSRKVIRAAETPVLVVPRADTCGGDGSQVADARP